MSLQKHFLHRHKAKAPVDLGQVTHQHRPLPRKKHKNYKSMHGLRVTNQESIDMDPEKLLGSADVVQNQRAKLWRKSRHPGTLFSHICEHLTTVAHVCVVGFTTFIVYLCFTGEFEFFTWHPFLYAIGWMCLMSEAVLMISANNILSNHISHVWRIRWHWIMQVIAVSCALAGFIIVVLNKEYKNKKHFKSYHGFFGLVSMIVALIPTCSSGIPALFNVKLRDFISPKINKFIHALLGIISVILGGITLILCLYTGWFNRKTGKDQSIFFICFVAVSFSIFWCLVKPFITFFQRLKTFF